MCLTLIIVRSSSHFCQHCTGFLPDSRADGYYPKQQISVAMQVHHSGLARSFFLLNYIHLIKDCMLTDSVTYRSDC